MPNQGSVALDDFSMTPECYMMPFTPSPPPITTTESPCQNDQFPCSAGSPTVTCIPIVQVSSIFILRTLSFKTFIATMECS